MYMLLCAEEEREYTQNKYYKAIGILASFNTPKKFHSSRALCN